ncbi:MAG TPA: DUF3592 domain-containing protein [Ktedonobacteraceae bacterium]
MFGRTVIFVVIFASLALGFYMWNQSDTAVQMGVSVKGTYNEGSQCQSGNCPSHPFVTFRTKRGTSFKFYPFDMSLSHQQLLAGFYDESAYKDGQSVTVFYDPTQPAQAFIYSSTHLWADAFFWFTLGGCLLLIVMVRIFRQDRSKKPGPPGPPMRR